MKIHGITLVVFFFVFLPIISTSCAGIPVGSDADALITTKSTTMTQSFAEEVTLTPTPPTITPTQIGAIFTDGEFIDNGQVNFDYECSKGTQIVNAGRYLKILVNYPSLDPEFCFLHPRPELETTPCSTLSESCTFQNYNINHVSIEVKPVMIKHALDDKNKIINASTPAFGYAIYCNQSSDYEGQPDYALLVNKTDSYEIRYYTKGIDDSDKVDVIPGFDNFIITLTLDFYTDQNGNSMIRASDSYTHPNSKLLIINSKELPVCSNPAIIGFGTEASNWPVNGKYVGRIDEIEILVQSVKYEGLSWSKSTPTQ